jgi:hypothetical protein
VTTLRDAYRALFLKIQVAVRDAYRALFLKIQVAVRDQEAVGATSTALTMSVIRALSGRWSLGRVRMVRRRRWGASQT